MMDASPTLRSFWNRCLKSVRYVGRHERPVLLLILFVSFASWGFAEIADEVMEGETMGVDERILLALRNPENRADPWGPPMVEEIARDITGLGGVAILSGLTLAAAGVEDDFTYVSTAGGAFLEWLEGKTLPGVAALEV